MTVKDAVAERLRQLCVQRGIKRNELANLSGVTPHGVQFVGHAAAGYFHYHHQKAL